MVDLRVMMLVVFAAFVVGLLMGFNITRPLSPKMMEKYIEDERRVLEILATGPKTEHTLYMKTIKVYDREPFFYSMVERGIVKRDYNERAKDFIYTLVEKTS